MFLLAFLVTILLVAIASMLIKTRPTKKYCEIPAQAKKDSIIPQAAELPEFLSPFMIFNDVKVNKAFTIAKGVQITENFYILNGKVEVLFDSSRIGVIKGGEITFNCFDFLNVNFGIIKKAMTDVLAMSIPSQANPYIHIKMLEKICFQPTLKFCKGHFLIAKLETLKATNFENFLSQNFNFKNYKASVTRFEREADIEDRLIYIVSGSLDINGVIFEKNSIFGYFGIFLNHYKGFKIVDLSKARADAPTSIAYVPYDRFKNAKFDTKMIKNLPNQLIYLGATAQWIRVPSGYQLIKKGTKCEEILLVENQELGCKECVLESSFENDYITEKIVDVIKIPKLTLEYLLKTIPNCYKTYTRKMFEKASDSSKLILISPASGNCEVFVQRLHKTLFSESIILRNTNVSEIMGRYAFKSMGELVLSENILKLKEKYKVVVIYLENEYSRLINLISPLCDIIFMVGSDICQNRFVRNNVEFIKLYDRRTVTDKKPSKIRSILFASLFSDIDSDEDESSKMDSKKVEIRPLSNEVEIQPLPSKMVQKEKTGFLQSQQWMKALTDEELEKETLKFRRIHHILSPKSTNFCYKDFERLGRYLLGQRFGLVLGGGGARGFAHIGVIQALEEENIPIDIVGGTSMGAFIGALYARGLDYLSVYSESKRISRIGSSRWYFITDFTWPFVSLFSGRSFDKSVRSAFGNQQIQNFWLEYYCITTNLKSLEECVHFNGSAFKYIRASMTISGIVPPVFHNDDILCDGAYVNNVPADVMTSLGVKNVISVDVSTAFSNRFDPYDSTSGIILFFKSLFESKQYLSLMEMQYRLTFLSTERKGKLLQNEELIIRPDVREYKTSDFNKFDEIVACGYQSAKAQIREWKLSGKIREFKKHIRRFSI